MSRILIELCSSRRGAARVMALATAAALLGTAWGALMAAPAKPAGPRLATLTGFSLPDTTGKNRSLEEFKDPLLVLVFTGTECPISNGYAPELSRLSERFRSRGVQFLGVNANPSEGLTAVARHAEEYRFVFPVLKDGAQELTRALDARVTPEAFVLDRGRKVRYRGRIDNRWVSRTEKRRVVTAHDLEQAIEALLAGKPVAAPVTPAFGCAIVRDERSAAAPVTYHRDVAPILQQRCQECHRPGQVAPFSLLTLAEARNWGKEIKTFTANRQMPPWKAEPGHGDFLDVRSLSAEQVRTLGAWVDAGMPEGDPRHAPPARAWPQGWSLGQPDLVLTMPEEFSVEADGEDVFHCFVLPTGLTEDKQVVAVEVRPGNPRVLHHVLNFVDTSGRARQLDAQAPGPGYSSGPGGVGFFPSGAIGGWAPGNMPRFLPKGTYRPLDKGSDVVIQVHYHKTGKPEKDRTSIGIYFAKEPQRKMVRTFPLTNFFIDIPPGADRYAVRANMTVPADARAVAITPHMHLLGKEMQVTATLPDGTTRSLVWIKDWDYRWQDTYLYREPVALPKGTRLDMVAYFDNSANNPRNPNNPPRRVRFGEQTTDEMAFAFLEYTFDVEPPASTRRRGLFGP